MKKYVKSNIGVNVTANTLDGHITRLENKIKERRVTLNLGTNQYEHDYDREILSYLRELKAYRERNNVKTFGYV